MNCRKFCDFFNQWKGFLYGDTKLAFLAGNVYLDHEKDPVKAARFAAEQQRLYTVHGKENILDDPYYNPNLTRDREDFSESDDLRGLKEGRITVRYRGA